MSLAAPALRLDDGRGICFSTDEQGKQRVIPAGGARRDRTDDLLLAKQALSQLSYGPFQVTEASDQ